MGSGGRGASSGADGSASGGNGAADANVSGSGGVGGKGGTAGNGGTSGSGGSSGATGGGAGAGGSGGNSSATGGRSAGGVSGAGGAAGGTGTSGLAGGGSVGTGGVAGSGGGGGGIGGASGAVGGSAAGGSGGSGGDAGASLATLANAFCAAARTCCAKNGVAASLDDCESNFPSRIAAIALVGSVTVDSTALAACIAGCNRTATTCAFAPIATACNGVFVGTKAEGDPCGVGGSPPTGGVQECNASDGLRSSLEPAKAQSNVCGQRSICELTTWAGFLART